MEKEFISLIKENEGIILKICNVYCSKTEDREDLYQDILIQLWKAYPKFKKQSKVSTWIYRIAFNTAVSRYRKFKKAPNNEPISDQHLSSLAEEDQEKIQQLYSAIKHLNKIEKAITMLYLDGVKYREIGEIMGLSESNIGFKINRIKTKLRKHLNYDEL